jgi:hypothetical protein
MRNRCFVYGLLFLVVFLFGSAQATAKTDNAEAEIKLAIKYLLDGNAPEDECISGFYHLLDAIVLSSPQTGYPPSFKAKVAEANSLLKKTSIYENSGIPLLKEAYRSINSGQEFRFPEKVSSIDDARKLSREMMESSIKALQKGQADKAVKTLLECAIMVVTPMKH